MCAENKTLTTLLERLGIDEETGRKVAANWKSVCDAAGEFTGYAHQLIQVGTFIKTADRAKLRDFYFPIEADKEPPDI